MSQYSSDGDDEESFAAVYPKLHDEETKDCQLAVTDLAAGKLSTVLLELRSEQKSDCQKLAD